MPWHWDSGLRRWQVSFGIVAFRRFWTTDAISARICARIARCRAVRRRVSSRFRARAAARRTAWDWTHRLHSWVPSCWPDGRRRNQALNSICARDRWQMAHVQWPFFMHVLQILRLACRAFHADAVNSVIGFLTLHLWHSFWVSHALQTR